MKKNLLKKCFFLIVMVFINYHIRAQTQGQAQTQTTETSSPTLTIGTNPTFSKGNIDTELLTSIIRKKQEEVKVRLFRNLIVRKFNTTDYQTDFNNFTTYLYMYRLMDALTSKPNKNAITKSAIEASSEFAYVFGLLAYISSGPKETIKKFGSLDLAGLLDVKIDTSKTGSNKKGRGYEFDPNKVKTFNIVLDACFDVILNYKDTMPINKFQFRETLKDYSFKTWYSNDNAYIKYKEENNNNKADLLRLHEYINEQYKRMINASTVYNITKESERAMIASFYKGLKKENYKAFILTAEQFDAFKSILAKFVGAVKYQFVNGIVSNLVNELLEDTSVEYLNVVNDHSSVQPIAANNNSPGYINIDVENLISVVYEKLTPHERRHIGRYVAPFFYIGTNMASFSHKNELATDNPDNPNLRELYFASEKIGIKINLVNSKYIRSFDPGETYYRVIPNRTWSWNRPQPKPLINDVFINIYASGLLYNVANLKSDTNFNYGILGTSFGVTLFNGLAVSVGVGRPFTDKQWKSDNTFFNFALDIPIIEYISELTSKKN